MKAAVYYQNGGPEVLKYEEIADPVCPADGVVIEVEVISIEGGDTVHRLLSPLPRTPHVVGYQAAGRVQEIGASARRFKAGDEVVVLVPNGSHAERVAAREAMTWRVPAGAELAKVACVPVAYGTAHEALFALGGLRAGQRVLIHAGAGGVGLAAIGLAKAAGAEILTTASSEEKLGRLRGLGAHHTINYRTENLVESVEKAIGRNAVDLVIDTVGGQTLQESVSTLKYRGKIINLGMASRELIGFQTRPLWAKNAELIGMSLMTSLTHEHERTYGVIEECIERVASGELPMFIDRSFALSEAAAAHAYIEGRSAFGRVVMRPKG